MFRTHKDPGADPIPLTILSVPFWTVRAKCCPFSWSFVELSPWRLAHDGVQGRPLRSFRSIRHFRPKMRDQTERKMCCLADCSEKLNSAVANGDAFLPTRNAGIVEHSIFRGMCLRRGKELHGKLRSHEAASSSEFRQLEEDPGERHGAAPQSEENPGHPPWILESFIAARSCWFALQIILPFSPSDQVKVKMTPSLLSGMSGTLGVAPSFPSLRSPVSLVRTNQCKTFALHIFCDLDMA